MPDLVWEDVRAFFDPDVMGSLPDVVIEGTGVDDWQAVLDLIRSEGWTYRYVEGSEVPGLPSAREVFARHEHAASMLKVWPAAGMQLNFWPLAEGSIDFDIDLRELQGQDRLDLLCGVFRTLGRRLGKPVLMTAEGDHGQPVIGYDPAVDRVVLLADPRL